MKFYTNLSCSLPRYMSKLLLIMKLTFVLLITAFLQINLAASAQHISLKEKNVSLYRIFDKISKQSGYDFVYVNALLSKTSTVTINVKNAALQDVLNQIFEGQNLQYKLRNKTIIVQEGTQSYLDLLLNYIKSIDVSGKVIDESGKPLAGASVKVIGKHQVSTTDSEGRFLLKNVDENASIAVSYIGYISQELKVRAAGIVQLKTDNSKLEDVVIVGYGTTKRKDLTGSVASVDITEVKDAPFTSFDQALSGKAAGVQVTQGDGSPGGVARIKIRGGTSILGGNDPLYIIDGVQVTVQNRYIQSQSEVMNPLSGNDNPSSAVSSAFARGLNSLGGLSINDIESIDILKDASSTAIYGSKAANGVIIITTKKGKYDQKPVLELNYYTGISTPRKEKLLNASQYKMILTEAATNLVNSPPSAFPIRPPNATVFNILNTPDYLGTANTDWLDLILKTAITHNADFSVRGGGKGSRYYTSLSYTKQEGVIKGTDFTRISGKVNLDNNITDKLRTVTNIDYGFTTNNITNGAYTQALLAPPTFAPYNPDGSINTFNGTELGGSPAAGFQNPLALINGINLGKNASLLGSVALEYEYTKALKFRSVASVNYNSYRQRNYAPSNALISTGGSGAGSSNNGIASEGQTQFTTLMLENTISYNKQFNEDNRIDIVAGQSWQKDNTNTFMASGQGFPDDFVLNDLSSAAITLPSSASSNQNSLFSFYARANYALKERYLLTLTGRSDASSKFPSNNRTAIFPSAGIAWRISQENFMKNIKWINDVKIRASAGYTGTQNIGDHMFRTLYSPVSYNGTNGLIPDQLGNNTIKWESTLQKDAGITFSLFNSRIVADAGIYEKKTTGLLFNQALQPSTSYRSVYANLASIRNRGVEIDVRADYFRKKNFSWTGAINFSFNRSLVTHINTDFSDPKVSGTYLGNTIIREGKPVGLFYGSQFKGIIQNAEQLAAYKKEYTLNPFISPYLNIGDPMYQIAEPGGFASSNLVIGNAEPKFYGGYTNTLNYRNISLISLFNFSYGGNILYLSDIQNQQVVYLSNKTSRILDRWTPENPSADRPRVIYGEGGQISTSSNNVYDGSFVKLKSVTLSYQLPRSFMDRMRIQTASIYVSATNLVTVTTYPGPDPEVSNDPYSLISGYSDASSYPTVRTCTIGFRLGF
jgi:TonB-linked SusC/RagA family outer membrane protein